MTDGKAFLEQMFDELINYGKLDAIEQFVDPDYVDHGPLGDVRGIEGFAQLIAAWREAVPDVHCEVFNVLQVGDEIAWLVRATGTHTGDGLGFPATGKGFETVSANLGRLRDGKAVEHWSEQGLLPFLVQVGIVPPPGPPPG